MEFDELKDTLHQAMIAYSSLEGNAEAAFIKDFPGSTERSLSFPLTFAISPDALPNNDRDKLQAIFTEVISRYVPDMEEYIKTSPITVKLPGESPHGRRNDKVTFSAPYALIDAYVSEFTLETAKNTLRSSQDPQERLLAGAQIAGILEYRLRVPSEVFSMKRAIECLPFSLAGTSEEEWRADRDREIGKIISESEHPTLTALIGTAALINANARRGQMTRKGDMEIPEQLREILTDAQATGKLTEELRRLEEEEGARYKTFTTAEDFKLALKAIGGALRENVVS